MEFRLKANYDIIIEERREDTFVQEIDEKDLIEYIAEYGPYIREDELRDSINDYIDGISYDPRLKNNEEMSSYSPELTLLNMDQIVSRLSYLIVPDSCCMKAPRYANYCPTCGKSLK